jgi:hypothetical protein
VFKEAINKKFDVMSTKEATSADGFFVITSVGVSCEFDPAKTLIACATQD